MIITIVGPTGVGKTKLSLELAKHFDVEIISGDSMQIYKGMDIGTAKIDPISREKVPHHMIDIITPDTSFSVADYQTKVRGLIKSIESKGKDPLIVGGTGFYIKSVLHDFNFKGTKTSEDFLRRHKDQTPMALYRKLQALDPATAKKVHPHNKKRVLRAIERAEEGAPLSEEKKGDTPLYPYVLMVLYMEREKLYAVINERVDQMFEEGLLDEARALWKKDLAKTAREAIGYKELFEYFDGLVTLDEAKRKIKQNTRRFAKRQMTYFKNQFDPYFIRVDDKPFEEVVETAKQHIESFHKQKGSQ
ncbi:MAG: tRNA (adenosine(37)-N6)-dimethylallyltransferase MiaA [Bacillota bacterium]